MCMCVCDDACMCAMCVTRGREWESRIRMCVLDAVYDET